VTADTPTGKIPTNEIDAWVATLERTMKLPSSYIQIAKYTKAEPMQMSSIFLAALKPGREPFPGATIVESFRYV
jgi:hypothetical protein